jgi:hypothetical protein
MQTHFPERSVHGYKEVTVFVSAVPTRRALMFVHGYGGDPIETWSDFHTLLPACAECSGYDLFFYGYDALYAELIASVGLFRDFMNQVGDTPASLLSPVLDPAVQRPMDFTYERIVIAAHSLGAVLARWAIVDALRGGAGWPGRTRSVYYAPAHSGAEVAQLAAEAFRGFGFLAPFIAGVRFTSPLVRQLAPDSVELRRLANDAKEAIERGHESVTPRRVLIAQYERIVNNLPFGDDPVGSQNLGTLS